MNEIQLSWRVPVVLDPTTLVALKGGDPVATMKQKAAARRNIKKAHAANRKRKTRHKRKK